MIITRLSGGLGNQMFQYAFGLAQADRHESDFKLDISRYGTKQEPRKYALDSFTISAKPASNFEIFKSKFFGKTTKEPGPAYSPEILSQSKGYFTGNWHTEKYFSDIADKVRAEFTLKSWGDKATSFKNLIEVNPASVSMHVRRGDYAEKSNLTIKHGLLPETYYAEALKRLSEVTPDARVYAFSDDIEWVKVNLKLPASTVYVSGNGCSMQEEMVLMSLCRNHIIANSTYSWWGAWLDSRPDKKVIAPKVWYASGIDSNDLVPEGWTRI